MAADQIAFAPVGTAAMMVAVSIFENLSDLSEARAEARRKLSGNYFSVMTANYLTWPLFMYVNFRYFPPQLNVLAVNVASFFWAIFLSSKIKTTTLSGEPSEEVMKREGWEPEPIYGSGPSFTSHHPHHRVAFARGKSSSSSSPSLSDVERGGEIAGLKEEETTVVERRKEMR
jgi:Mpv17 / PMP22 family